MKNESYLDLDKIKNQCDKQLNWNGGCAIPDPIRPEVIILLIEELRELRELKKRGY